MSIVGWISLVVMGALLVAMIIITSRQVERYQRTQTRAILAMPFAVCAGCVLAAVGVATYIAAVVISVGVIAAFLSLATAHSEKDRDASDGLRGRR